MKLLPWYDLLIKTDLELREMGVPAREVGDTRWYLLSQRRALAPTWARTIGLWGRVASQVEIEQIAGCTPKAARRFAERHNLWFAGKYGRVAQWHLARECYEEAFRTTIDGEDLVNYIEIAKKLHILPVEAKLYVAGVESYLEEADIETMHELVELYSEKSLIERWKNSDWMLALPQSIMERIGGGDDHLGKRIHERLGREPREPLRRKARPKAPG